MPRIRQLPPDLVAQIAAGEVVERPASVVKELLENAIDAGANRVDIDLDAAGTELIRVVDDGCGIDPADLPLAFSKNATSKLASTADLFAIHTLGFRGEALASIAAVAHVTLQSRTATAPTGCEVRCDHSQLSDPRPWGGPVGTRIEVRHLFGNIPARKKFLKSLPTELGHVSETVTRLALCHPHLHVVLRHNGKLVYEVPALAGLPDRIGLFFGGDVRDALLEVDSGPGDYRVVGYVADPKVDRGHQKQQYLFVNGRWFRDRSVAHALQEAYRGLLMVGRHPVGFLFLTVPTDAIDVNVHPQKTEVRFRDSSLVYSLVRSAVKARLLRGDLVPALRADDSSPRSEARSQGAVDSRPAESFLRAPVLPTPSLFAVPRVVEPPESPAPPPTRPVAVPIGQAEEEVDFPAPEIPLADVPPLALGSAMQVHDSYIVLETADGMLVIDQHALHERILYEQLRRRVRDGQLEVQRLLIPEAIDLPPDQHYAVLDAADALAQLGLDVSDFGGNTILLASYPTLLSRRSPHVILRGAIDYLLSKDRPPSREILLDHLLATMACKAAVKAGDRLTPEEVQHLLVLRQLADDSHHCPHGRPTSLLFSRQQLDRQFGRI